MLAALQAPKRSAVRVAAVGVDQVLHEGPTQCHVYDVDASTDAEHGDASLKRTPEQRDLELVPIGVGRFGSRGRSALRTSPAPTSAPPISRSASIRSSSSAGARVSTGSSTAIAPVRCTDADAESRDQVRRLIPEAPARALGAPRRYRSPAQTVRS